MKILIAVPTYETIYPDTYKAIWYLDKGGHETVFDFIRGYDVATARNKIAKRAIEVGSDYVLMVDNDVTPPHDALTNLLEAGEDVCLGYYAHRDADNIYRGRTSICKLHMPDGQEYYNYPLESEYTEEELKTLRENGDHKILIHGGGMGCALIRTDVFNKIQYPWFGWKNYRSGITISEDLYFCERCKKHRIPIYADTRVGCGHLLRHIQEVM